MRAIRLTVEYDGTDLCGWQRQQNGPTVQAHLEAAVAEMVRVPTRVTGASRTDAGVHAEGQVCAFQTDRSIPALSFLRGLNKLLPPSIAVRDAAEVGLEFHPRHDSLGKHYRYSIWNRSARSPMTERTAWHRPRPLDLDAMAAAATHLLGEKDFSAFRAQGCQSLSTRRHLSRIEVAQVDGFRVDLHVEGNAFLRNMVRIIAGTLVAVGEGRLAADALPDILASGDRSRAGQTAPPQGLSLVEVFYDSSSLEHET